MSAKTKDERITEKADELYSLLKDQIKYSIDIADACPNFFAGVRCDCSFCVATRLITWIDKKPLTL